MKKTGLFLIIFTMLFAIIVVPAAAESSAGEVVEVKLKIDDENIEINGEKSTIKKPFTSNGYTLVPLRVITTAFGAELSWDPEVQGITLQYGETTIELQVGSKTATVNGTPSSIPAAPVMVDGTTMVPLRFITENFGAVLKYDEKTKEIILTGKKIESSENGTTTTINTDAGKTKIGDSYYGWMMNYPSGLVKVDQSFNGDYVEFADAKGKYSIQIFVNENTTGLEESDLLDELADYVSGTIVDKRFIESAPVPYGKIVTKNRNGSYSEDRAYIQNDKVYYYTFIVNDEDDYKNANSKQLYQELMDSFVMTFDKSDKTIKDITLVSNGKISFNNNDYGLSLRLPTDWRMSTLDQGLKFYSMENDFALDFKLSSLEEDDTLELWMTRVEKRFKQEHAESYRTFVELPDLKVAGVSAEVRKFSFSYGSDAWYGFYDLFLIKGNYRFNLSFSFKNEEYNEIRKIIPSVIQSISIDMNKIEGTFGYIEDEYDVDMEAMRKFTNKQYGYTIEVPKYWKEGSGHDGTTTMEYEFNGGYIEIVAEEDTTLDEVYNQLKKNHEEFNNNQFLDEDISLQTKEDTTTTFKGMFARKMVIDYKFMDNSIDITIYMFMKDQVVYSVVSFVSVGVRTPEMLQRIDNALESLTFQ